MAEEQTSPIDRMVELFVYAPVGLAFSAKEELPKLVATGRERIGAQLVVARFVGRLVVTRAMGEAERLIQQAVSAVGVLAGQDATGSAADASRPAPPAAPEGEAREGFNGNGRAPIHPAPSGDVPDEAQLAIPGYDSLSAPQVVQRLGGLAAPELDAVRRYEQAHRGRRTILSKISQLQADVA